MFKRILVHLNPRAESGWMVSQLAPMAASMDANVELFCCGYSRSLKQGHMFDQAGEQQATQAYTRQCEAKLETLAAPFTLSGVECSIDACWEPQTVDGILEKAQRYNADLIVLELSEHSLLERVFGEMEAELARRSPIPLLLLKRAEWRETPMIAAGIDPFHEDQQPHPLDHRVLAALADVSKPLSGLARVLHCIHTLPHSAIFDEHVVTDYNALREHVSEEHHKVVDGMVKESALPDATPVHYLNGEAHSMLPRYAKENELDLLILGHAEHALFDRLLNSDMVTRIMDDLPCSLLVIK